MFGAPSIAEYWMNQYWSHIKPTLIHGFIFFLLYFVSLIFTGDMAYFDEEGYIYIQNRASDVISHNTRQVITLFFFLVQFISEYVFVRLMFVSD